VSIVGGELRMSKEVKCEPLKCKYFKRIWDKMWDRTPMDKYFIGCPAFIYPNKCNDKQRKGNIGEFI